MNDVQDKSEPLATKGSGPGGSNAQGQTLEAQLRWDDQKMVTSFANVSVLTTRLTTGMAYTGNHSTYIALSFLSSLIYAHIDTHQTVN